MSAQPKEMNKEMQMRKLILLALIVALTAMPGVAVAQAKKGSNGGAVVTSERHPIEFVRNGLDIVFYVSDHDGSPVSTKEMKGRATILDGGKTVTVPLKLAPPVGEVTLTLGGVPSGGAALNATI